MARTPDRAPRPSDFPERGASLTHLTVCAEASSHPQRAFCRHGPSVPAAFSLQASPSRSHAQNPCIRRGETVEMGGGSALIVHEAGKAYPLTTKPGDAYDNQVAYFVDCVREGITPAHGCPGASAARSGDGRARARAFPGCSRRVPRPQVGGLALWSTRGPSTPAKRS